MEAYKTIILCLFCIGVKFRLSPERKIWD